LEKKWHGKQRKCALYAFQKASNRKESFTFKQAKTTKEYKIEEQKGIKYLEKVIQGVQKGFLERVLAGIAS
jgi:hypothetical protein